MTVTILDTAAALFRVLETQDAKRAVEIVAADNHNVTASASPPACQLPGPAGVLASSAWLRSAFPDLSFVIEESALKVDTAWLRLRMKGTHVGPFVQFEGGEVAHIIPPTNKAVDVEQLHLVKVIEGKVVRHEALRDDLGMLDQLGVFPPTITIATMVMWKLTGRAARAADHVSAVAMSAAATVPGGNEMHSPPSSIQKHT